MRLIILDFGYSSSTGHHQAVDTLLARAAAAQGIETLVLSHVDLPLDTVPPFSVERCLRCSPYLFSKEHELLSPYMFVKENEMMEADLKIHLPAARLRPDDIILAHTVMAEQLIGILRWHKQLELPELPLRFIMRFPPGFSRPYHRKLEEALAAHALVQWGKSSANVRFYSDLNELSTLYHDLSALRFTTTPIAIDFKGATPAPRPDASLRPLTWVFAGDARPEKGLELVIYAWERYSLRHPEDRLITQVAHSEDRVRKLLEQLDHVQIIEGTLHGQAYFDHISSGDCILLPYHPGRYRMRTSHILLEALGMGRPVIISPQPWMEEQLKSFADPVGVAMPRWTDDAMEKCMEVVAANAEPLLQNAMATSHKVREMHNADKLLECLLEGL